jgi:hypothetical protein
VRSADSTSSGPLLREFLAFSDQIYGPVDLSRDFKALAEDMAVVPFPERFIRQTDLHTANISEQILRYPDITYAIEALSCYAAYRNTRLMTPSILDLNEKAGKIRPEGWQTFAVQGRCERERDDEGAARDGQ